MTVTAYWQNQGGVPLGNNSPTVAVRMRLPNTGKFVIWGKVTVINTSGTLADVTVSMTTLDGATTLDSTTFQIGIGYGTSVPLQSTLDLSQPTADQIVDIRCALDVGTTNNAVIGGATSASLIAIPVDALSEAAAPPPPS
jgi:hypothetical protein